ncbi:hypothetical protein AgCh_031464 [Apium graveolens]
MPAKKAESCNNSKGWIADRHMACEMSSDKDEVGVASDLRVFLNGSKLVGKNQVKVKNEVKVGRVRHTRGGLCVPGMGSNGLSRRSLLLSGRLAKLILIDCEQNKSCYPLVISALDFTMQLVETGA